MSKMSAFAAYAHERGVGGGWDKQGVQDCLNDYLKQRDMGLSKQLAITEAEIDALRERHEEEVERAIGTLLSKDRLTKRYDRLPADDVQPGEHDA